MANEKSTSAPESPKAKAAKKKKMSRAERDEVAWNATIGQTLDYFFIGATKQESEKADVIRKELLAVGQRLAGKSARSFNARPLGMALVDVVRQWAVAHAENLGNVPARSRSSKPEKKIL
jgi:hypothetical protein